MDKYDLIKEFDSHDSLIEIKDFDKLCERAKGILFNYLLCVTEYDYDMAIYFSDYGIINHKMTPIEQIFNIAYYLYTISFDTFNPKIDSNLTDIPPAIIFLEEMTPQKEIFYKDKKYIADFAIDLSNRPMYNSLTKLKYVVELDGKESHSNTKQVNYDYERENNLKELGYKVIRFTGSQVYNTPFACVDKLVQIILNDIKGELNYAKN